MKPNGKLEIHFGALADTIAQQVRTQGYKINTIKARSFQKWHECILHLLCNNILTEKATKAACNKLNNKIIAQVKLNNKNLIR